MSFAIEWLKGADYAGVTVLTGTILKSKLLWLVNKFPNKVKIIVENKDSSLFAHVPVSYVKINSPRQVPDEQREAAGERLKKMWWDKQVNEEEDW